MSLGRNDATLSASRAPVARDGGAGPAARVDAAWPHSHTCTSVSDKCAGEVSRGVVSDVQQLVQASRLYYELGETQSRVAEILGVTRPQVSRLLKRARAEGIVEIRIVDRTAVEPGRRRGAPAALRARRRPSAPAIAGPEDLTRRMVGRLAAEVLRGAIRDGAVVGIGDGASVSAVADALAAEEPLHETGATVVPLCGGYWFTGPAREPYRRVADGDRRPADRAARAGPRRRSGHEAVARRARRRSTDRRPVGAARGRGLRDRRPGLERGRARAGHRRRAGPCRRGRRGPRQPVRPRRPVRRATRCATGRSRSTPATLGRVPVRIGVAGGRRQGPADPRRAAGGRRCDAGHGRSRRPRPSSRSTTPAVAARERATR